MKYYETRFEDYVNANKKVNLHPKLQNLYKLFPKNMNDLKDNIFETKKIITNVRRYL